MKSIQNIKLTGNNPEQKREEIKEYFLNTWKIYEKLFEIIEDEKAYYQKANNLRHPIIFYFGHTATFFINKLILAKIIDKRINPKLESMFAVGVDEMNWDDLDENNYQWVSLQETKEYRDLVKAKILNLIETLPLKLPISWESPFWIILMCIEHERIHIETSSVLIRELPIDLIKKSKIWKIDQENQTPPSNELIFIKEGKVKQNKTKNSDYYGWDNEYGLHKATIHAFKASKFLVSNQEFLLFVEDKGYQKDQYWEDEGTKWKNYTKVTQPRFWIKEKEGYSLRHIDQITPLLLNHPVEVNYHEAKAYCNWLSEKLDKNLRLPSEDEWYRLIQTNNAKGANINLKNLSSTPIDKFPHGDFYDLRGNVWQWTQTPIYPYEGFEVHPIYDDFTTPTFDNKHYLIKGGSFISMGNETLLSARYAFRKHFYQHAGFRYVESNQKEDTNDNIYESDTLVSQYIEFGWGEEYFGIKNYPATCASLALKFMKRKPKRRALDIGCAIGRSSFELAREFDSVTGIDFTTRFISMADKMKNDKKLHFTTSIEGNLFEYKSSSLKDFDLESEANRVEFWQADACNLKPIYKDYDLIFAGNLIDRLYNPKLFLDDIAHRLNSGGLFIMTSPYTWLEEFTPKDQWIGGYRRDGKDFTTLDGLKEILEKEFKLIDTRDIPFIIRETKRKYQHTVAQMSIWEKK